MDLMILDASFAPLGVVDAFFSLQWTRRYYEVGSFELHTDMAWYALLRQGRYVYRSDAAEVGVIEGLAYTQSETEEELTVSGRFLECLLERRVIPQRMELSGTRQPKAGAGGKKGPGHGDDLPMRRGDAAGKAAGAVPIAGIVLCAAL